MNKMDFARQAMENAAKLAEAINALSVLSEVYIDRGYQTGGADPIADADLTGLGPSAAQVSAYMGITSSVATFWTTNHAKFNQLRSGI